MCIEPFASRVVVVELDAISVGILEIDGERSSVVAPAIEPLALPCRSCDGHSKRPPVRVDERHMIETGVSSGRRCAAGAVKRVQRNVVVVIVDREERRVHAECAAIDVQHQPKCAAVERGGLVPMLCVGEKIEERDAGQAEAVVIRQLRTGLSQMTQLATKDMTIAYEPVWAIGTGRTATPDDAAAMHGVIRQELLSICGDRGRHAPILYGGSVNPGNARDLLSASNVDGLLVGGASLDASSWLAIVRS